MKYVAIFLTHLPRPYDPYTLYRDMSYMYGPLRNLCYSNFRRNHVANKYRSQIEYTRNADDDFTTPGGATAANSGKMGILKSSGSNKFSIHITMATIFSRFYLVKVQFPGHFYPAL